MESSVEKADRLITLDELGDSQVAVVEDTPHGTLAVGISGEEPFAVSNTCRHLFASLGKGDVEDGQLRCPSHHAKYDVKTGKMTLGPQGRFKLVAGPVKATLGARALDVYPVEVRDGAIWLT
jgi:nitrite reductase/ring-hydroxylating ferredoxin subunit